MLLGEVFVGDGRVCLDVWLGFGWMMKKENSKSMHQGQLNCASSMLGLGRASCDDIQHSRMFLFC